MNQKIITPHYEWTLKYHNANDLGDIDYCTHENATNVAYALDSPVHFYGINQYDGFVHAFLSLGFREANVSGKDARIKHDAGCNCSANANRNRLLFQPSYVSSQSEPRIRAVVGHELFHGVQQAYSKGLTDLLAVGGFVEEGQAELMMDKGFLDIDNASSSSYRGSVNAYLQDPNRHLFDIEYQSTLFWNYLTEQFGEKRDEPGLGVDFIRSFLETLEQEQAWPFSSRIDVLDLLQKTLNQFDRVTTPGLVDMGVSLRTVFQDFTTANYAKQSSFGTEVEDPDRFIYFDEAGGNYNNVTVNWSGTIPKALTRDSVEQYGAKYYEAYVDSNCVGVVGFHAQTLEGGVAAYTVLAYKGSTLERIWMADPDNLRTENSVTVTLVQNPASPYTKLAAVVVGFDGGYAGYAGSGFTDLTPNYEYTFACGAASLEILDPTNKYPAYVNAYNNPERFLVRLQVTGPPELGSGSVEGLTADMFSAWVGSSSNPEIYAANEATILGAQYVQGEYWLECQAPAKSSPTPTTYNLKVLLGTIPSPIATDSVVYEVRRFDQMLVVDRSGSMKGSKMEAAKNAAKVFVTTSQSGDQMGLVSFNGNDTETPPDRDAAVLYHLEGLSDAERALLEGVIDYSPAMVPVGYTSIGDGLRTALEDFIANGQPEGEDYIILLSDGQENEPEMWGGVKGDLLYWGIRIHAIALGSKADQGLLHSMAEETRGRYWYVEEYDPFASAAPPPGPITLASSSGNPMALELADTYLSIMEEIRRYQRFWEVRGNLDSGKSVQYTLDLEEKAVTEGVFALHWSNPSASLGLEITRPDGTLVSTNDAGVVIRSGTGHVVVLVSNLVETTWTDHSWTLEVESSSGAAGYAVTLSGKVQESPGVHSPEVNLYFAQNSADPDFTFVRGLPMPILASITDSTGPVLGARVTASVRAPGGSIRQMPLYDDGAHLDGSRDDGVYGNVYAATTEFSLSGLEDCSDPACTTTPEFAGSYNVVVKASGTSNLGRSFQRIKKGSFALSEHCDPGSVPLAIEGDGDGDGMPDRYEALHDALSALVPDDGIDADGDGLTNGQEYQVGTDPCNMDTDQGGETDGSELARGANPLDGEDDALPAPLTVGVVTHSTDGLDYTPWLHAGCNLIRYPVNPAYHQILLYRSTSAAGPFGAPVATFGAPAHGGLYRDCGLVNGTTYYYHLQALDLSSNVSASSHIFSGTPRSDPIPPNGFFIIENGRDPIDTKSVTLTLRASEDTAGMLLANESSFVGATWQAFNNSVAWTLAPDSNGVAWVYARFRDAAGNESLDVEAAVTVVAASSLGGLVGVAQLEPLVPGRPSAVEVTARSASGGWSAMASPSGAYTLSYLAPGPYTVTLQSDGYESVTVSNVSVSAGMVVDLGLQMLAATWLGSNSPTSFNHLGPGVVGTFYTNGPGSFTLDGSGNQIFGIADSFDIASFEQSGDFDVRVRVASLRPTAPLAKAGLMARESLEPTSRMTFERVTPRAVPTEAGGLGANDVRFAYRTGTNSPAQGTNEVGTGKPSFPNAWLRLVRSGSSLAGYQSTDGRDWILQGTQDTATWKDGSLAETLRVGLAVCRGSMTTDLARAEFRDFGSPSNEVMITEQPGDTTINDGESASFAIHVAGGTDFVEFRWFTNDVQVPDATNRVFETSPLHEDANEMLVSVLVSNVWNSSTALSDYAVVTVKPSTNQPPLDFGDAPDPNFPTLLLHDGARHEIVPGWYLGDRVDAETDGRPDATAIGDDLSGGPNDEDGVFFLTTLTAGGAATIQVVASTNGLLDAWIDFDQNGSWETNEQIAVSQSLMAGSNTLVVAVPPGFPAGEAFARFRFSESGGLGVDGYAPNGEVEDYRVEIQDAIDLVVESLAPTFEASEEDIFEMGFRASNLGRFTASNLVATVYLPSGLPVVGVSGEAWDTADMVHFTLNSLAVGASETLTLMVRAPEVTDPDGELSLSNHVMVTHSLPDPNPSNNTVENEVRVRPKVDYGDALDSYQTLRVSDGPRHRVRPDWHLGPEVDPDPNGMPSGNADGDDLSDGNDDEDGIVLTPLVPSLMATARVDVVVPAGTNGYVNGWLDLNRDGDFADADEHVVVDAAVSTGLHDLAFLVPASASIGPTFARFRLTPDAGISFVGPAPAGEVEDFQVTIEGTAEEVVWVRNPTSGIDLYCHVHRPTGFDSGNKYPGVVLVPGGTGEGTSFDTGNRARRYADLGFMVMHFDPDGRGQSTDGGTYTDEDYNGFVQQDGLRAVVQYLRDLPETDDLNLGIFSSSYGVTMASGMLARYPHHPGVKFLLDWEGPANRTHTLGGSIYHDPTDDDWWQEREASGFISSFQGYYLRVQTEVDHVQTTNEHALLLLNLATHTNHGGGGRCVWTRLNSVTGVTSNRPQAIFFPDDPPPDYIAEGIPTEPLIEQYLLELSAMPPLAAPIRVVFDLHMDPLFSIPESNRLDVYNLRRDAVTWALDQCDLRGAPVTFLACGEFYEYVLDDAGLGDALLVRAYHTGGSIGTHMHREIQNGPHDWSELPGDPPLSAIRTAWEDHIDLANAAIARALGLSTPAEIRAVNNIFGTHIPNEHDRRLDLMEDYGFAMHQEGPEEEFYGYFQHYAMNPYRPAHDHFLNHDPNGPVVLSPFGPVLGKSETHYGIAQDMRVPAVQARFLLELLNWLQDVHVAGSGRVWTMGWAAHGYDLTAGQPARNSLAPMLNWLKSEFVDQTVGGYPAAAFSSAAECRDVYQAWETIHPGEASFTYPASTTDWTLYPYLRAPAAYLADALYDSPMPPLASVRWHALTAAPASTSPFTVYVVYSTDGLPITVDLTTYLAMPTMAAVDTETGVATVVPTSMVPVPSKGLILVPTDRVLTLRFDMGDAPAGYPVLLADDGARHDTSPLRFGMEWDAELDGQPSPNANRDDLTGPVDDEEGVVLPATLVAGTAASVTMEITGGPGVVDAWIDWNRDLDWDDPGEHVVVAEPVGLGAVTLPITVPTDAAIGLTAARFRLSTAGTPLPTGYAPDGEVVDRLAALVPPRLLLGHRWDNGHFRLTWNSVNGMIYKVQVSSNLVDWETVDRVTAGDDTTTWTDPEGEQNQRFYRLMVE